MFDNTALTAGDHRRTYWLLVGHFKLDIVAVYLEILHGCP